MSLWYIMTKLQESYHLRERLIRTITEFDDLTNSDTVEDLIEEGAEVNSAHGTLLPLQCACMCSDSSITETLITHGAHVNALDGYGRAAIHYAAERDVTCLDILIANNADVNVRDRNDDTPLHWAVFKNQPQCTRILLQNNADVNAEDYNNDTPLSWAAQKGSIEPMRILLEYNPKVDTVNLSGNSPIYRSAAMLALGLSDDKDAACLDLLMRASGNFELRDEDGTLPGVLQQDNRMREMLMPMCSNGRKLQQLCRYIVRMYMGVCYMPGAVPELPLPKKVQQYLLLQS